MNCHTAGHPDSVKLQKEHGDRVTWFKKTPAETMDYILAKTKLIDLDNLEKSLLLLKPLNEVSDKTTIVGTGEFKGNWKPGYGAMTSIDAANITRK